MNLFSKLQHMISSLESEHDRLRSELATYQQMSGRAELLEEIDRLKAELTKCREDNIPALLEAENDRDFWKSRAESETCYTGLIDCKIKGPHHHNENDPPAESEKGGK